MVDLIPRRAGRCGGKNNIIYFQESSPQLCLDLEDFVTSKFGRHVTKIGAHRARKSIVSRQIDRTAHYEGGIPLTQASALVS